LNKKIIKLDKLGFYLSDTDASDYALYCIQQIKNIPHATWKELRNGGQLFRMPSIETLSQFTKS